SEMVNNLGAIAASVPFAEVYTSLQRGVVDCAATSTVAGNAQKWYEVSDTVIKLPLGWGMSGHVAYKPFWEGLDPGAQSFLLSEMERMEGLLWDMARDRGEDALSCNMGGECRYGGTPGEMKLYELDQSEVENVRNIVAESVLPDWAAQ